jgi:hypothetical protein
VAASGMDGTMRNSRPVGVKAKRKAGSAEPGGPAPPFLQACVVIEPQQRHRPAGDIGRGLNDNDMRATRSM